MANSRNLKILIASNNANVPEYKKSEQFQPLWESIRKAIEANGFVMLTGFADILADLDNPQETKENPDESQDSESKEQS
jgi:hypothetical protein